MLTKKLRALTQAGDTIVEVMVVLAVLGLAIGISYATATSSLRDTQSADDNSQASAILQSQLEDLRYLAPTKNPDATQNIFRDSSFCITSGNNGELYQVVTYPASSCLQQGTYTVEINWLGNSNFDTFVLTATWDTNPTKSVTFNYRVHQ